MSIFFFLCHILYLYYILLLLVLLVVFLVVVVLLTISKAKLAIKKTTIFYRHVKQNVKIIVHKSD